MPKIINRHSIYNVDTRWNSAYNIIEQFLELLNKYTQFVDKHLAVKCLLPTEREIIALQQLAFVLKPFKTITLKVLEFQPSLACTLEQYWDLNAELKAVINGKGSYALIDQTLQNAFKVEYKKFIKYRDLLAEIPMVYAAHIINPRC